MYSFLLFSSLIMPLSGLVMYGDKTAKGQISPYSCKNVKPLGKYRMYLRRTYSIPQACEKVLWLFVSRQRWSVVQQILCPNLNRPNLGSIDMEQRSEHSDIVDINNPNIDAISLKYTDGVGITSTGADAIST